MYKRIALYLGLATLLATVTLYYTDFFKPTDAYTRYMLEAGHFGPPPTDLENWDTSKSYSYSKGPEEIYPGVYQTTYYAPDLNPPVYEFEYEAETLEGFRWLVDNRYKPTIEKTRDLFLLDPEDERRVFVFKYAVDRFYGSVIRHEVKFNVSLEEDFKYIEQIDALLEPGGPSGWVELYENVWERILVNEVNNRTNAAYRTDGSREADTWLLQKFKTDADAAAQELAELTEEQALEQGIYHRNMTMIERYQMNLENYRDMHGELPEFARADYERRNSEGF